MEKRPDYPDPELLLRLQAGKDLDDIIRYLYRSNYGMVHHYIKENSGTDADAEDIFQEIAISFVQTVQTRQFRGECSISSYLYTLARNAWINEVKKRGRAKLREEKFEKERPVYEGDVSHHLVSREIQTQLEALLHTLGTTCKSILLAFYFEGLSMKEILGTLNYENEQVVRNKKYKCLKQLEQLIAGNPTLKEKLQSFLTHE